MSVIKPFYEDEAQEVIECLGNICIYSADSAKKPLWIGINQGLPSILTNTGNIFIASLATSNVYGNGAGLTNLDASKLATGTIPAARAPFNLFSGDMRVINGNVGIGVNDPKAKLHLDGSVRIEPRYLQPLVNPATEVFPDSQTYIAFGSGAASTDAARLIQEGGNNNLGLALELYDDGSESFSIRQVRNYGGNFVSNVFYAGGASGRVGIGTREPTEKLAVIGNVVAHKFVGNIDAANIVSGTLDLARIPPLPASSITSGSIDPARLPVLSSLGVGTASPTANLEVRGNITATGNVSGKYFFGDGSYLTGISGASLGATIDAAQIVSGTIDKNRLPPEFNRTQFGAGLTTANIDCAGNATFQGNAIVMGNLAVANTNPTSRLSVNGNAFFTGDLALRSGYIDLGVGHAGRQQDAGKIGYGTFDSTALNIVGWGTTAGQRRVRVYDTLEAGNAVFSSATSPARTLFQTTQGGSGTSVGLTFNTYAVSPPVAELRVVDNGDYSGKFVFSSKIPGSATNPLVDRMTVDTRGNLTLGNVLNFGSRTATNIITLYGNSTDPTQLASRYGFGVTPGVLVYEVWDNTASHVFGGGQDIYMWLSYNGAYHRTGVWGTWSDVQLKENIQPARNYLHDLCALEVVKYSLKEDKKNSPDKLGFIAQQVEQVFPGLVDEAKQGDVSYKTIKQSVLTPMLVKAVQELSARVEALEAKLAP